MIGSVDNNRDKLIARIARKRDDTKFKRTNLEQCIKIKRNFF